MRFDVQFKQTDQRFNVGFNCDKKAFNIGFKDFQVVERVVIPPEYGLITYDHNRTITVS